MPDVWHISIPPPDAHAPLGNGRRSVRCSVRCARRQSLRRARTASRPSGGLLSQAVNRFHRRFDGAARHDRLDGLKQANEMAARRLPIVDSVNHNAKCCGLAIVFPVREPGAIRRMP
jgi:hypothetical protein